MPECSGLCNHDTLKGKLSKNEKMHFQLQVFQSIAKDVMVRLRDSQSESPSSGTGMGGVQLGSNAPAGKAKEKGCC